MTYVISKDGQPLMSTSRCGKVYRLLKQGKAKVIKRCPFTIKLLYETTKFTQPLTLAVDTGSGTLGTAVADEKGNIYYMSKVEVRNDIASKMDDRRKYRRSRRAKHTRYRPPRFSYRKNSFKKDRFSPTMISKFNAHIREIEYIKSILPITTLVLETGTFDPYLMKHEGEPFNRHWGYQKGPNYGFANTKAKVLNRDNHECQYCHGKHKDNKLEVHHIIWRSQGGSDEENNLITLCHTCHKKVHNGEITLDKKGLVKGSLKYATQMNSIRIQLLKQYPDAIETFGYITQANRYNLQLPKDHHYDACVIATGGKKPLFKTQEYFQKKVMGQPDRILAKFRKIPIQLTKRKIHGFKRYDKVSYQNKEYFIYGTSTTGNFVVMNIDGTKPQFNIKTPGSVSYKKLKRIESRKTVICSRMKMDIIEE